jgi:hypothetical protein
LDIDCYSLINSGTRIFSDLGVASSQVTQEVIEAAYLEVIHDYFITEIARISHEVIRLVRKSTTFTVPRLERFSIYAL